MYIKNHNMQAMAMPSGERDAQLHLRIWCIHSAVPRPCPEELCPSKFRLENTNLSPTLELECGPLIKDLARSESGKKRNLTRSGIKTSGNSGQSLHSAGFLEEVSSEISRERQENQQRETANVPGVWWTRVEGEGTSCWVPCPWGRWLTWPYQPLKALNSVIPPPFRARSSCWGPLRWAVRNLNKTVWSKPQGPAPCSEHLLRRKTASFLSFALYLSHGCSASQHFSVSVFMGCGFGDSICLPIFLICSLCPLRWDKCWTRNF